MDIKGKVHCFFEQSGTFKQEFIKLGIPAEDYDIQDHFGQTDHTDDLFQAIEDAWDGKPSLFDSITRDDLILAFFPCIYFCAFSQMGMTWNYRNYRKLSGRQATEQILERAHNREKFFALAVKMFGIAREREIRLIMENPWSMQHFLKSGFVQPPSVVDKDRTLRGDYYRKPTAYWFLNCTPTNGVSIQQTPKDQIKSIWLQKKGIAPGICSEDRSMISPDYARNFICDFILGKEQEGTISRGLF